MRKNGLEMGGIKIPDDIKDKIGKLPPELINPSIPQEPERPRIKKEIPRPPVGTEKNNTVSYGDGKIDSYGFGGNDEDEDNDGTIVIKFDDLPVLDPDDIMEPEEK